MRTHRNAAIVSLAILFLSAAVSHGTTGRATPLAELAQSAGRIFRGHCIAATTEEMTIAGVRIRVTSYRFSVGEHLKGTGPAVIEFRQVGTRDNSRFDLGRIAGLPTYRPGDEYVLFLLPESSAGLTSPAGAGEGAFPVQGDVVSGLRNTSPDGRPMHYTELREAVLREIGR